MGRPQSHTRKILLHESTADLTPLLVADYSTYQPSKTQVKVTLPLHFTDRFTDIETGEQIATEGAGKELTVILSKRRARMLYGGPGWHHLK